MRDISKGENQRRAGLPATVLMHRAAGIRLTRPGRRRKHPPTLQGAAVFGMADRDRIPEATVRQRDAPAGVIGA